MKRLNCWGQVAWIVATLLISEAGLAWAQQAPSEKKPAPTPMPAPTPTVPPAAAAQNPAASTVSAEAAPAKTKKFRGRLPAYFSQVVDEEQRKAIYAIQEEYSAKIVSLKTQLETMTKERDDKIAATLTASQREKIEGLKATAKAKRAEKPQGKQDDEQP